MGSSDRPVEHNSADVAVKSAKSSETRRNSLSEASNSSSKSTDKSEFDRNSSDSAVVPSHYSSTSSIASSCSVANYSGTSASPEENSRIYSYNNRIPTIQSRQVSAIGPDVIASNIQKNIEHCKLQRLQQMGNIIRNNNEASQFLSRGNVILRMRGLPYDCTAKQVVDFFEGGEVGVSLVEQEDGVLFVRKPDGRATGDAFVMLASEEDIALAMSKHKMSIGTRYIELFRSSSGEVMNRAMDLRHMEQQQQQQQQGPPVLPPGPPSLPLIATLPHMTQQLLPQASVATGPKKNCIRLRGLPYEAQIEHVLEFLGDFSNSICFRGVHMVYTTQLSNETCYQSHPSGEAFIQMVSEHAAYTTAAHRHNKYMVFGKKNRYIEVFQCSNDDMNFVLSGMAPSSPQTPTAPPVNPRSLVPTPGGAPVISPYGPSYPMGLSPTMMSHTIGAPPRISPFASPIPAPAPYSPVYYYYPSPPVSPTSAAYYSTIPPHAAIISECMTLPPDLAIHHHHHHHHPGEAVATM